MRAKLLSVLLALLMAAGLIVGCAQETVTLGQVGNFAYADGILSFDGVEDAEGYNVSFVRNGETVYADRLTVTTIDIGSLGLEGRLTVTVSAYAGESTGEPASYSFTVLSVFGDVVFEAEEYLYNFGTGKSQSNFRNNPLASNGAYVGGIDNAGQGIYIDYLCPVAGTFEIESHYLCGWEDFVKVDTARQEIWVNGEYQDTFVYTENTGWGGAGSFSPAVATAEITLQQGWNTISVMKNGTSDNNWGEFAELDYLVLKGDGTEYDADSIAENAVRPSYYRLEAEMGSPRKYDGIMTALNPCIVQDDTYQYSNGFLMGGIEHVNDGVEWHFNSPMPARYQVRLAYAAGEFDGSSQATPTFIVTQEAVGLFQNADFERYEQFVLDPLPYTGWNQVEVAQQTVEITLEAGDNYIYCLLLGESGYFQIDYIDLIYLGEAEETAETE